ncbi:MAG: glycosyltransferase family 2 protein [Actinomycetota bacterium]|nr:glycosyltransferase family 2 protein [Actinomycetota bacterium]
MTELAGPLHPGAIVRYRAVLTKREKLALHSLCCAVVVSGAALVGWLLWPSGGPSALLSGRGLAAVGVAMAMACVELIRIGQSLTLWLFASRAADPVPMEPAAGLRAAVLTTIVPGKEPVELVERTLRAMRGIRAPNGMTIDVWLLDEGDDPDVAARCRRLGVHHFSRRGVSGYNTERGEFKARTKHGNHNSWRHRHEADYDIVAQMDPDHIPHPDFLLRTAGYFNDPDVAFVVAPQVYGNLRENLVARGSAFLAYVFHGIIQRGGNGRHAPLLIGTNHVYRPTAFRQIGGYQDSIIEDHLTSMVVFGAFNPATGERWKGVYTPDILSVGEGPTTFTDFFNQQKRWAYGIWEIVLGFSPRVFPYLRRSQRLTFTLLQSFYPSVAVSWVLGNLVTASCILSGVGADGSLRIWTVLWLASLSSSFGLFLWLRRFNLVDHERRDWGLAGMSLMLMCIPVYVSAAAAALTGRRLSYAVTAKGDLASPDTLATFRQHLAWAAFAFAVLVASVVGPGSGHHTLQAWMLVTLGVSVSPIVLWARRARASVRARPVPAAAPPSVTTVASHGEVPTAPVLDLRGSAGPVVDLRAAGELRAATRATPTTGRTGAAAGGISFVLHDVEGVEAESSGACLAAARAREE